MEEVLSDDDEMTFNANLFGKAAPMEGMKFPLANTPLHVPHVSGPDVQSKASTSNKEMVWSPDMLLGYRLAMLQLNKRKSKPCTTTVMQNETPPTSSPNMDWTRALTALPMMLPVLNVDNYIKGETQEIEDAEPLPFTQLSDNFIHMKIRAGSKLQNVMGYALKQFKNENRIHLVFSGTGSAVTKTVTCAEILKRKYKKCHQITKVAYRKIEEIWEPKVEGLDRLKVVREIPAIHILLSKVTLDESELGYQPPQVFGSLWLKPSTSGERKNTSQTRRGRNKPYVKRTSTQKKTEMQPQMDDPETT